MYRLVRCSQQYHAFRRRSNIAHVGESRPDYGLAFQAEVIETFKLCPLRSESAFSTSQHDLSPVGFCALKCRNLPRHPIIFDMEKL